MSKDLSLLASLLAAFLVVILAVGSLAPTPVDPAPSPPTDGPGGGANPAASPTPPRAPSVLPLGGPAGSQIRSTTPGDGERAVPLNETIAVEFDQPVELARLTWTVSPSLYVAPWLEPSGFRLLLIHPDAFAACTEYTVWIGGAFGGTVPNPWTFTAFCGGSIDLRSPLGGETWSGGSTHRITWSQSSLESGPLGWTLDWVAGGSAFRIAYGSASDGDHGFDWEVPRTNRTNVRVRACLIGGGTERYPLVCDTSADLAIDSAAPALVAHSPPDGAIDMPRTLSLSATLSEPMDRARTEAAFTIMPAANVASRTWTAANLLVLRLDGLRKSTRYAWSFGCSATDRSDPGNPLASCGEAHEFTTGDGSGGGGPQGSSLQILAPAGGESWTGGSNHSIPFAILNNGTGPETFTVSARYGYAGGTRGGPVGGLVVTVPAAATRNGEIPWSLPWIDALDAVVNVTAENATDVIWDESGPFAIDSTPPQVVAAGPSGSHVPLAPTLTVGFSEPLVAGSAPAPLAVDPDAPLAFAWAPAYDRVSAELRDARPCTTYTVSLGGLRDVSDPGNPLVPLSWTFTTQCLPTVRLLSPVGGEDWTGGSPHEVRWTSEDADDASLTITLSYSTDGGADGFPNVLVSGLVVDAGPGATTWALPRVDSERVLVRLHVSDPAGNTATGASAAVFTIDSTPPRLLEGFPGDGATGLATARALWFAWSERVDRASFATAFHLMPAPGGVRLSWSDGDRGDLLLVSHDRLRPNTGYTARFLVSARDDSNPGNRLEAVVVMRFATAVPPADPSGNPTGQGDASGDPPARATVAVAVIRREDVAIGVPTAFDGTGSTGPITEYVWRIVEIDHGLLAVLKGERVAFAFPREGRYTVTLTVWAVDGASDDETVEIAVLPFPAMAWLLLAAAGTSVATGLSGATERARFRLSQLFLVPLYARRKKDELLEHELRGMIRGYVLVHPGDSYVDIKRNLGLSNGTLTFHLGVLEREGIIQSQSRGTRKVFYPEGAPLPENGGNLHEVQLRILRAVRQLPGIGVGDIAGGLGISSQHALWHLRALVGRDLVRFERHGFRLRCYPGTEEGADARPVEGLTSADSGAQDS